MPARLKTTTRRPVPAVASPPARPIDLALARVHLRLGSVAMARAELEILAGQNALDIPGQVDLAEARWRTGNLTGAGEAAAVALASGEEDPIALAIAAEAAAALGRPTEARRLASLAIERVGGPIDAIFAGMPRAGVWPADATEPPPTAGTLFHHEPASSVSRRSGDIDPDAMSERVPATDAQPGTPGVVPEAPGFWDGDRRPDDGPPGLPDPAGELEAARAALLAGALDEANLRFALALRLAPALAPAILEATDGLAGPAASMVRGDAYRLVGFEAEARRAYAAAAWSGTRDRRRGRRRPSPDDSPAASDV